MTDPSGSHPGVGQDRDVSRQADLPKGAKRPSDEVFAVFYRDTYAAAVKFVLGRTTGCDAEALAAEAYILTWHRFLEKGELDKGWLYGVLRNKIGDHYRSQRVRDTVHKELAYRASPSTLDHALATEQQLDIERALQLLKPEQAEVLLLAYWSDLTTAEGARALNLNPVTYRVRLTRAKAEFRRALQLSSRYGPERGLQP
ncbi:MAG: sigma-70 family RNA polymerase sigma factor [Propionibacteriaceae bacterium]|nr:sigma-70 family RNA polymerase sigma factor [Propionibacteriaceae bacterium]